MAIDQGLRTKTFEPKHDGHGGSEKSSIEYGKKKNAESAGFSWKAITCELEVAHAHDSRHWLRLVTATNANLAKNSADVSPNVEESADFLVRLYLANAQSC